eukprot:scaffold39605_cov44-Attheya_sp.AAC.1
MIAITNRLKGWCFVRTLYEVVNGRNDRVITGFIKEWTTDSGHAAPWSQDPVRRGTVHTIGPSREHITHVAKKGTLDRFDKGPFLTCFNLKRFGHLLGPNQDG